MKMWPVILSLVALARAQCPSGMVVVGPKIAGMCPALTTASPGDDCCQTPPCSDKATNCAANTRLCNDTLYASLMAEQCAKSCGRCSVPNNQPVYGNCGAQGAMSIGPCVSQVAAAKCGTGNFNLPGYACDAASVSCCPIVDTTNHSYELGPAVGGMCPVGNVVVYGTIADHSGDGICIALKSVPESTYVPPASTATTPSPGTCGYHAYCDRWVRNGFCSSDLYTMAQKNAYCGVRCELCTGK